MIKSFIVAFIVAGMLHSPNLHAAEQKIRVVATQTCFAGLVKEVARDRADVAYVAPPKANVHFVEPRPSDVQKVSKADLYVHAGLDLEAWSDPLLEAAGNARLFRGAPGNVDLSAGIPLRNVPNRAFTRAEGDLHLFGNPHYAMNPENLRIMVSTLLAKLKEVDSSNAAAYEQNAAAFLASLDEKIREWKNLCAHCGGKEIFSYHDDIVYFADFLGLRAGEFLEPKPGIPPTPRHLEFLEKAAREKGVKAIVLPTYYPRDAAAALGKKIGIRVVTICQNPGEIQGTEDLFGFFDYNFKEISGALQ